VSPLDQTRCAPEHDQRQGAPTNPPPRPSSFSVVCSGTLIIHPTSDNSSGAADDAACLTDETQQPTDARPADLLKTPASPRKHHCGQMTHQRPQLRTREDRRCRFAGKPPRRGERHSIGPQPRHRRYRDMAKTLGYEGHIAWAEAMP
jgi:hypothetical protein